MILVTVGAQMPFDRLVRAVDCWARARQRTDVLAQIGGGWRPEHVEWIEFLTPPDFRARVADARAIVAHSGTGSILTALEAGKPIVVMPRRAELGETRNDHQVATAERFVGRSGVLVAADETELAARLDDLDAITGGPPIRPQAAPELLAALRAFIDRD